MGGGEGYECESVCRACLLPKSHGPGCLLAPGRAPSAVGASQRILMSVFRTSSASGADDLTLSFNFYASTHTRHRVR